jgi:hypothetical protein
MLQCLYDLDRGIDKLVLIQSVILMGFWYTDPQDHTGAWYWIGIAITLRALGLHRSPQLNGCNQRFQEALQPLICRIWWSCCHAKTPVRLGTRCAKLPLCI